MSISIAQVKAIMICKKGTLETSPNNPVYIGLRTSGGKFLIEDHDMIQDYMEREHRNKLNFKSEFTSLQIGYEELEKLLRFIREDMGVDAQIITTLEDGGVSSQGIYNLSGNNKYTGIDFELIRSSKEASTKIILEASYDYNDGISLVSAANINTAHAGLSSSVGKAGIDYGKLIRPNIDKITFGSAVSEVYPLLVPKEEIKDWKFSVKTKGEKTLYNRTITNMLSIEIEIEILNSSVSKIKELLEKTQNQRIGIDIYRDAQTWETWVFNLVPFKISVDKNDKTATVKVSSKGNVYLDDVVLSTAFNGNGKVITFN